MDVELALAEFGGFARVDELRDAGVSRAELSRSLESGRVIRLRRGIVALSSIGIALHRAGSVGGRLAAEAALEHHGVWLLRCATDRTPVLLDPKARPAVIPRDVDPRWDRGWSGDERLSVSVLHALWQIGRACGRGNDSDDEAFLVAVESALNRQLIRMPDLDTLGERLPAAVGALLDFAVDSAQSGLETLARRRLAGIGIAARSQARVLQYATDLLIGESLILELDGQQHESHADMVRDGRTAAAGYVTLRYDSEIVLNDWALIEAAVGRSVQAGLHQLPVDGGRNFG